MGRGGAIYLTYTALVLLAGAPNASAEIKSLWKVDIDESPAPPPEKGPPLSAHAVRNRNVLPYEIVGIIAAYVVFVLFLGSMLVAFGRRLRKQAQEMAVRPREMVPLSAEKKGPTITVAEAPDPVALQENRDKLAELWLAYEEPEPSSSHSRIRSDGSGNTYNSRNPLRKLGLALSPRHDDDHDGVREPLSPGLQTGATYDSRFPLSPQTPYSFSQVDMNYQGLEQNRYDDRRNTPHQYTHEPDRYHVEEPVRFEQAVSPVSIQSRRTSENAAARSRTLRLREFDRNNETQEPKTPGTEVVDMYRDEVDELSSPRIRTTHLTVENADMDEYGLMSPGILTMPRSAFPRAETDRQVQRSEHFMPTDQDAVDDEEEMWGGLH